MRFHKKASSDVIHVQVSAPHLCSQGAVIRIHWTGRVGTEVEDVAFIGVIPLEGEVQTKENSPFENFDLENV